MEEDRGTRQLVHEESPDARSSSHGDDVSGSSDESRSNRSRRRFLQGTAVAGASAVAFASNVTAGTWAYESAYDAYDDEYRTVVEVTDAGADPTGGESITSVLEDLRGDDTLLKFPDGEYYMDRQFRYTNFDNFGIVGDDATLVPANYHDFQGPQYRLFRLGTIGNPGGRLRFRRMQVDQTAPDTGIRAIEANVTDYLDVEKIAIWGEHDSGTWGPGRFNIVDPNGTGRVVDFYANGGGVWSSDTPHAGNTSARGPVGIIANNNQGELTFRRCQLDGFPGSGLYAIGGSGKIIVHGGVYRNSTSASLRIGGEDSIIRWPTVHVEESNGRNVSQRGIRIENGSTEIQAATVNVSVPRHNCHGISVMNSCESAHIENLEMNISGDTSQHGLVVSSGAGDVTLVDSEITHDVEGGYPVWIRDAYDGDPIVIDNLTIEGSSGDAHGFRDGIHNGRDGVEIRNSDIDVAGRSGATRVGINNTGDDVTVTDTTVRASHYALAEQGNGSSYADLDAESYDSGRSAFCLYDTARNVEIFNSLLRNGISDFGSSGTSTWGLST